MMQRKRLNKVYNDKESAGVVQKRSKLSKWLGARQREDVGRPHYVVEGETLVGSEICGVSKEQLGIIFGITAVMQLVVCRGDDLKAASQSAGGSDFVVLLLRCVCDEVGADAGEINGEENRATRNLIVYSLLN